MQRAAKTCSRIIITTTDNRGVSLNSVKERGSNGALRPQLSTIN
jgi:hypothetical protein